MTVTGDDGDGEQFAVCRVKSGQMASRLGFFRDASKKVENRDVPQNSGQLIILFTNVGKNGIKLNAASPNIEAIKVNPNLAKAGLKVIKNKKYNPRLIIHSIPAELKVRGNQRGHYCPKPEWR